MLQESGKCYCNGTCYWDGVIQERGTLQLPGSSEVWKAIGYFSETPIIEGQEVTLYRTKETSPEFLKVNSKDIIQFWGYEDAMAMYRALLDMLKNDLEEQQLLPRDIMVIDMDTFDYGKNCMRLSNIKSELNSEVAFSDDFEYDDEKEIYKFDIHTAGQRTRKISLEMIQLYIQVFDGQKVMKHLWYI